MVPSAPGRPRQGRHEAAQRSRRSHVSSPDGIRRVEPAQLRRTAQALAAMLAVDTRRLGVLPLAVDDTRIVLAFSSAPSGSVVAEIAMATAKNVVPVLADRVALADAIGRAYPGATRQPGADAHRRAARPSARCRRVRTSTSPRSAAEHSRPRHVATARRLRRARRRDDRAARVPRDRRGSPAVLPGGARARRRLLAAGPGPLPHERVPPARLRRRRAPCHPVRDRRLRRARPAADRDRASPSCRAAWCSSPARPGRASRRRWPRWSTSSTAPRPSTS